MKRMLTLLFMVALFLGVKAQVLFNQDFESGTLDPMKAVDVDGKTVNANVASFCGPTFTVVQQAATNKAVVSTSWFEPVGQADDWLISPPITVTSANTFVSWRAYSPDANYRDGYQVRISTTNDSIASFGTLALNVAAELTTWTTRSIRLTNYVGQTIYVAWRNNSTDKYLLYMDDFKAEILKGNNVIVKNLTFEKYNPVATEVPIKISIENHGANPVTSLFFDYNAGGYTYTDTVTGLNVAPLKSLDLTHSISHVVGYNEYPISVEVRSPNGIADEDSTNNTITRYMYGISEQLPKKVVVEEATGTWCIWCPRGAVNMDLIWGKYPDLVMPIAVHNYDPMTVADYDTPFSASVSGYPSGHVDRKTRDIDPLNFETAVLDIQNRLVPVQVTTEVTWNSETRSANIRGTAHSSIETEHNAFRFVCVITEDGVHGTDAGYAQANIYSGGANGAMGGFENLDNPVPADQMIYNYVARAILGGFSGLEQSVPDYLEANDDFTFDFSYQVPDEFNADSMRAIIFILDDETGEILNGDMVKLAETTSVPLVPAGHFALYPNPTSDLMNLQVDYQTDAKVTMKIYDTYGKLIRDLGNLDLTNGLQSRQLHVADLSNGQYILELRNKNSVTALPFTKM